VRGEEGHRTSPPLLRIRGQAYPVLLPSRRDPRLHLAAVIVTLQVLGQTVLGFELSVAQILLSVGTCAVLESAITLGRRRVVMWPASALLTGNGVALIVRTAGTAHGDWWSLRGWHIFVIAAALSLLSKYAVRVRGRHVFNPSNIGLVVCFLAFGTARVNPLDLWWGPWSGGLVAAVAVIVVGGMLIVRRMRMLGMTVAFTACFAAGAALIAATGHCMTARWHYGAVCGESYWSALTTSPEVLIFMFFMITDPKTTPASPRARVVFGGAVALVATVAAATQATEFGTKVAILGGLAIVCAVRGALLLVQGRRPLRLPRSRRLRVVSSAGALALWFALVPLAALAGRPSSGPDADTLRAVASRRVPGAQPALPPVTLSDAAARADPSLTQSVADRMVRDLVDDLAIESNALRHLDDAGLAAASGGSRLAAQRRAAESARGSGRLELLTWRPRRARIVLVRDPANPQASPVLGVELRGLVHRERCDARTGAVVADEGSGITVRLFALDRVSGIYLIDAEYPTT
jgi:Na+-translocating ferredoxin:NAD+ oxidoreductase RnfD subunit